MARFELQGPDGARYEVEAPDEMSAVAAFKKMTGGASMASPGSSSGVGMNVTAGLNQGLYGTLGAPVDLMRGAMNLGIRGVNAVAGTDVGMIPEDSFGGSRFIAESMGGIDPRLDPKNTTATTPEERIARGLGEGVGYTIAPQAAVGAAARAGSLSPRLADTTQRLFGSTAGVGAVAGNSAIGGVSGAGAAAGMESASDEWKPVAGLLGGLGAGTLAVGAAGLPALGRAVGSAASDYVAPLSRAGQERIAGETLRDRASNPGSLREALGRGEAPLLEGSNPTTFQASGDMGLGALEREVATRRPEAFNQRRAEQNSARLGALDGLQPDGAPDAVSSAVRARLQSISDASDELVRRAQEGAQTSAGLLGQGITPEAAGTSLRGSLEAARAQAKTQERALWNAVDPDGTLTLSARNLGEEARAIPSDLPLSAKPPAAEEAAIYEAAQRYGQGPVAFAEVTALSSRVKAELRAERQANGESPAYARLSRLNAAIERDLGAAIDNQAQREAQEVAAGRMAPDQTIAVRLQNAPAASNTVYTPSGRAMPVEYEVVDASSLVSSNRPDGRPNPAYPAELQPRDRSRAASDAQVSGMARNLQPDRLGPSQEAGTGAPIVGPDGIVESGNGRVAAILRAYGEGGASAQAYRDYLTQQGYNLEGMAQPVLVRRRGGEMSMPERARFAQEANASSTMAMSASEQAATDASRLTPDVLRLYRGGDPASAENREFAKTFLGSVADRGQEGTFVTSSGGLSLDGAQRMRSALLHSAYEDGPLVAALVDEGDENIRAFGRALDDLSGDVARLKARVASGEVDGRANLAPALVDAARIVQGARARGIRLADAVAQQDAFNRPSPAALQVLSVAYGPQLSGRLSRERLGTIMRGVIDEAEQQTAGARLFGEPLSIETILEGAQRRYGNATGSISPAGADRAIGPTLRQANGGSGSVPGGPGQSAPSAAPPGGASARILPDAAPTFNGAARERLTAARGATRDRAETFDNRTLRPLRARASTVSPYDMPASVVPQRIFSSAKSSPGAINAFRKAVGDAEALPALQGYAVDRLRTAALRPDGTLDPAKVASWRRSHADALRSFPDLDRSIADAATASETMARVATSRRAALDDAQKGILGRLAGLEDPGDVTRVVGSIFTSQDGARRMSQLRNAVGDNAEAQAGLRKAVAEHIASRFIGNTEAGTSRQGTLKSDGFQTFIRQNKPALQMAGFGADEIDLMAKIGADLQRANRSIASVKLPGGSNTAQDSVSMLQRVIQATASNRDAIGGAVFGGSVAGLPGALVGGVGASVLAGMRQAGLQSVDDILADALLNPGRAKLLLAQPSRQTEKGTAEMLAALYRQSAVVTGTVSMDPRREPPRSAAGAGR